MAEIPLTKFVDFVAKAGTPKYTVVKKTKQLIDEGYIPSKDMWKQLRDRIVEIHRNGEPVDELKKISGYKANANKAKHYPDAIKNYIKWAKGKNIKWFEPPKSVVNLSNLNIRSNPELGLIIDGNYYAIKLYFKSEYLPKNRASVINEILHEQISYENMHNCTPAILDVRKRKLTDSVSSDPTTRTMLYG
ncbi:hypothetical protein [Rhodovibrio sodomensis]|uniref:hypothetical protein n=1 Tax=Rhodovibrio sodomensis TaxID=1088 RepID=UPI00190860A8|nr:hypothetical protein [Rhodovibrio sodomensis]